MKKIKSIESFESVESLFGAYSRPSYEKMNIYNWCKENENEIVNNTIESYLGCIENKFEIISSGVGGHNGFYFTYVINFIMDGVRYVLKHTYANDYLFQVNEQ